MYNQYFALDSLEQQVNTFILMNKEFLTFIAGWKEQWLLLVILVREMLVLFNCLETQLYITVYSQQNVCLGT